MTYASGMLQVMRKGVSAAEKYAEIGGRENAPKCECHGLPKSWKKSGTSLAGGTFVCKVLEHEKLRSDPEYRERENKQFRKYDEKRRSDPEFRRVRTLYQLWYRHKKKKERYGDAGLTLRDHGEESGQSGNRVVAR